MSEWQPRPPEAREVRACLRRDRERLLAWRAEQALGGAGLAFDPSYQAVWLHRWSGFLFARGRRLPARLLWQINLFLTGADISPLSRFGAGLLLRCPLGVVLVGRAGADLTVGAQAVIGGGLSRRDIGAGPGLPVLGDGVELEVGAIVLGPVRIGSGARIGPRCVVAADLPAGAAVEPEPVTLEPLREARTGT